jgi:hypothetical protein
MQNKKNDGDAIRQALFLYIKKTAPTLIIIAISIILFTPSLHAFGIGLYGTGGIARQAWNNKIENVFNGGGGIILDTAVAKDTLYNYRFTLGSEQNYDFRYTKKAVPYTIPFGTINDGTTDHNISLNQTTYYDSKKLIRPLSISMSHAFGFGVFRNNFVRLWLGPEIALSFMMRGARSLLGGHAGGGLILGLNINMGDLVTLSLTGSCLVEYAIRFTKYSKYEIGTMTFSPPMSGGGSDPFSEMMALTPPITRKTEKPQDKGLRIGGRFNIALLFRVNDTYRPVGNPNPPGTLEKSL